MIGKKDERFIFRFASRVHNEPHNEEIPDGTVPVVYRRRTSVTLLPKTLQDPYQLPMEGIVDGADHLTQVSSPKRKQPLQEDEHFRLVPPSCKHPEFVYNLRGYFFAYPGKL